MHTWKFTVRYIKKHFIRTGEFAFIAANQKDAEDLLKKFLIDYLGKDAWYKISTIVQLT